MSSSSSCSTEVLPSLQLLLQQKESVQIFNGCSTSSAPVPQLRGRTLHQTHWTMVVCPYRPHFLLTVHMCALFLLEVLSFGCVMAKQTIWSKSWLAQMLCRWISVRWVLFLWRGRDLLLVPLPEIWGYGTSKLVLLLSSTSRKYRKRIWSNGHIMNMCVCASWVTRSTFWACPGWWD